MDVVVIWEFRVREGREAEFGNVYGPTGEWCELFKEGDGYLGTELYRDEITPSRYLTMDRWVSSGAYEAFKQNHLKAYEAMDGRSEQMTEAEIYLGAFMDTHGG